MSDDNWKSVALAAQCWCPFVRHQASSSDPPSNRWGEDDGGLPVSTGMNNCVGSECMAWVWRQQNDGDDKGRCGLVRW